LPEDRLAALIGIDRQAIGRLIWIKMAAKREKL